MTEVRTKSKTGGEKGVKPERHDLIPRKGTAAIARVFGFGASKYADHNWRRGYEWSKSISALQRHVDAFADGDTYDEESGLPHLAHAGFHILVLLTWLEEQGEGVDNVFDDRWPHSMERARRKAARKARRKKFRKASKEARAAQEKAAARLLRLRADLIAGKVAPEELAPGPWHIGNQPLDLHEVDPHTDWGSVARDSMWILPEMTFKVQDTPLETMALAVGISLEDLPIPARFVAGPDHVVDTKAPVVINYYYDEAFELDPLSVLENVQRSFERRPHFGS